MISENTPDIIVQPNVIKPVKDAAVSALEQFNSKELETIGKLEDKEKKGSLNFERMSSFLGIQIDTNKVFVLPLKEKPSMQATGIDNDFSDGFYRSTGDYIVVYFSEDETDMSLEQKIVHESFHKAGLRNIVISQSKDGDNYSFDVSSRRMGFALVNIGQNPTGNPSPGLLLEEMAASYAGFAYTQQYADEKYQQQIDDVFAAGKEDQVTKQLGKRYALLNSQLDTMGLVSLYAFLFDTLRVKLGMDEKTPLQEVVQSAIRSRQDVSSIREFIGKLEEKLGKGSYSTLRGIDISGKAVDAKAMQEAINLIST